MKTSLNIIGIIPARGGSVRLPLKNIKLLAGKPLISYIISAALQSKYLRRIIVSTDHPEIKKISLQYGAEAPFIRPQKISGNCSSVLVIQHAVEFIEKAEKKKIDIVVTLQPTSPFCQSKDIDSCIELLLKHKTASSVFSAVEIHKRPEWIYKVKKGSQGKLYISRGIKRGRATHQQREKLFYPNGAVYATKRQALFQENTIISKDTLIYVMPRGQSVDIDEEIDFKFAEFLAKDKRQRDFSF